MIPADYRSVQHDDYTDAFLDIKTEKLTGRNEPLRKIVLNISYSSTKSKDMQSSLRLSLDDARDLGVALIEWAELARFRDRVENGIKE